ncbi:formate dehydrogenase accessory sulfurtransferase FdhD [Prosthecomicrobium pneumaticum]|uniref:Sulfur carrier protein FdhD n=1 Tax=Prosthecomicrobium pneumaticum TaxID=81895 RepID=A0A7W9FPE5_9HYPH|nr:formate dehydrogenase accessory sulfurtransferase FdhD [Prosthecomicrobium pneumaticum]MBB5754444.1 FdhD protein [Prosthecomicrobium pneumaticum]
MSVAAVPSAAAPPAPRPPVVERAVLRVRAGVAAEARRVVPEETPVALVFDGTTEAVMMATPADLDDFARGFAFTEGLAAPGAIRGCDVIETPRGIEARLWLVPGRGAALAARRRRLAGATGCGLCGIESLEEAVRPPAAVPAGRRFTFAEIAAARAALEAGQALNRATRALHAAGFWTPEAGLVLLREDVGRHNALDKLAGALLARDLHAADGVVLLTSRVSVEMVQKAAAIGAAVLVAVSVPTALALDTAEAAGMTLVAVARDDGFEVFTRPDRILGAG